MGACTPGPQLFGFWQAMATTAADVLVKGLIDWGVNTVFGIPGDGINGIVEALRLRQNDIRFIQARHEESAAFMACGYAKFTGRLGVCLATSGPGGIHMLNGLLDSPHGRGSHSWHSRRSKNRKAAREGYDT
jgi:glyoxylate carboligase